jgi:hypothetical protein
MLSFSFSMKQRIPGVSTNYWLCLSLSYGISMIGKEFSQVLSED